MPLNEEDFEDDIDQQQPHNHQNHGNILEETRFAFFALVFFGWI